MERYLGMHLPKGRHTTLGNSALTGRRLERQLRRERLEIEAIRRSIRKTCRMD